MERHAHAQAAAQPWFARVLAHRPPTWVLLTFYFAYIGAAGLGQGFAIVPGVSVTFWPPNGIVVAALLLSQRASWPWWVAAACLAELTCNGLWFHNPVPFALIYFAANALEAITAAWLIGQFSSRPFRLDRLDQVAKFVILGGAVAPMVGATVIALTDHFIGKHNFLTAWPLVWLGDGSGLLVSTPLTLVCVQLWQARDRLLNARGIEAVAAAAALAGIAILCFRQVLPTPYLTMLPLLWIAARFQLRGAAVALGTLVLLTAGFAVAREGQSASPAELLQHKVTLQAFLGISAFAALFVAALAQQNRQSLEELRQINARLEDRVAERTAELSEREQQFRQALDAAGALVYTAYPEPGSKARVHGLERVTGYPPDSVPLTTEWWWSVIHPDDLARYKARAEAAISGGGTWRDTYRIRHADGSWRHVEQLAEVIRDTAGHPECIVGAIVDITEQRSAELALMEEKRFTQGLINSAHNLLYLFDLREKRFLFVTAQVEAALGRTPEEIVSAGTDFIERCLHPDDRPRFAQFQAALGDEPGTAPHRAEYRMRHKDGRWIWMEDYATVYRRGPDGQATQVLGAAHDIMDLKRQEQQKQLLMREVNHRSKNVLSLVQAIARQTAHDDIGEFLTSFNERLVSLAAAHDLLVNAEWKGVMLRDLAASQLGHFKDLLGKRITLDGPVLAVNPAAAQALAMALHELATNAGKYGALSNDAGTIRIAWRLTEDADGAPRFEVSWIERGGPEVRQDAQRGFGSTVIERISKASLNADVTYDLAAAGVTWQLSCNASEVLERRDTTAAA